MIIEQAYAKINLTLNIMGLREDGYHELESLMVPISLCDNLTFYESDKDEIEGMNIPNNIIIKTIELFKQTYNINKCVRVVVEKKIPLAAGLAGGSADSSATLRGLNRLWNLGKSLDELCILSSKLGSDNPFCLYNRPAIMKGRGERLEFVDLKIDKDVLIINPNFMVSTKEIFTNYKELNTPLYHIIDQNDIMDSTYNDLESVTFKLYPKLYDIVNEINNLGFRVRMSGSGPTLYVIDEIEKLLKLEENLKKNGFFTKICQIFVNF